jgi:hypothetical protein
MAGPCVKTPQDFGDPGDAILPFTSPHGHFVSEPQAEGSPQLIGCCHLDGDLRKMPCACSLGLV